MKTNDTAMRHALRPTLISAGLLTALGLCLAGYGVYVYMVGLGWFEPDGTWVSWQGFLRHPEQGQGDLGVGLHSVGPVRVRPPRP